MKRDEYEAAEKTADKILSLLGGKNYDTAKFILELAVTRLGKATFVSATFQTPSGCLDKLTEEISQRMTKDLRCRLGRIAEAPEEILKSLCLDASIPREEPHDNLPKAR